MIKNLNYILILVAVFLLAAIAVVFIFGTMYSWAMSETNSAWRDTLLYEDFVGGMNLAVGPLAIALVIVLALCIPKRLFSGVVLLQVLGGLLALTLGLSLVVGLRLAISFLLLVAMLFQVIVIVMTMFGSRRLVYQVTGFYIQIGSAFLHMGIVLFLFDLILVGDSTAQRTAHLNIFWAATVFIGLGMVLVFYSNEISSWIGRRRAVGP